jgi:hypothetical protein
MQAEILSQEQRLFVDMGDIALRDNIVQTFHQATKMGRQPVLKQDAPWEHNGGMTASVVYDSDEQMFKAWYMAGMYAPTVGHVQCLATSLDGVHWERPSLRRHAALGSTANNIVIPADYHDGQDHWESMLKDTMDPDVDRRYKALGWSSFDWDGPLCGIYSATSPDGISWRHSPEPVFRHHPRSGTSDYGPVGDAQSLMIDTLRKRYVAFLRDGICRSLSISDDFVHWSTPKPFLQILHEQEGLYNNTGFPYGAQYLGFLTHFDRGPLTQTQSVALLTSRDGETWMRIPGEPIVPVADVDGWDRFQILLTGAPPIRMGDKMYIYYRGTSRRHNKDPKEFDPRIAVDQDQATMSIGLATLRLDGFASLSASFDGGCATTNPFILGGGQIAVNVTADHGQACVELLDEAFAPIEGYTQEDAVPVTVDDTDVRIAWRDRRSVAELGERPVRLRFRINNARIYSYRCTDR